jgi:hypothetical protein
MKLSRDYLIIALSLVVLYLLFMSPKMSFASKSWNFTGKRCATNNECSSSGGRCMNNGVKGKFCATYS